MKESESVDGYLATIARIEPDISMIDTGAALASISISLKRIADALESSTMTDKIAEAIGGGIWEGAQAAIGTWNRSR